MATVLNPTTVSVTDTAAATQAVTSYRIMVATTTGGPYSASSAIIPLSSMTNTAGIYTIPFASVAFSPALVDFQNYFAVVEAINSSGTSGGSPEASFQIVSAPQAPTAFSFS